MLLEKGLQFSGVALQRLGILVHFRFVDFGHIFLHFWVDVHEASVVALDVDDKGHQRSADDKRGDDDGAPPG